MHLDLQEEDEVFALLFARPRGVFFFVCVCGCAYVYACCKRPPTTGESDWQPKDPERSKHWGKQMRTRTITTPCVGTALPAAFAPRDDSLLARLDYQRAIELEHNKNVDVQLHFLRLSFFGPHIPILYIYDLTKLCLRRINGYCLQTQRKRCRLLFPHVLHKSAMHSKTAHGAAWCNAAACTCTAKGYTASGAGSNTPCK